MEKLHGMQEKGIQYIEEVIKVFELKKTSGIVLRSMTILIGMLSMLAH